MSKELRSALGTSHNMFCKSAFLPFIVFLWKMVHNTGLVHTEDFFQVQVQFASSECFFLKCCEFAEGGCGVCFLLPESLATFCQPVKCFHPLQQSDGAVRELQGRPHGNKSWARGKLWTKRLTLRGHSFKHTSLRPPPPVCDTRVNCVHHSYHSYFHRAELCHHDFTAVWTKP